MIIIFISGTGVSKNHPHPGPILQRGVYRADFSRENDKTILHIPREKSDPYYKEVCIGVTSHEGIKKPYFRSLVRSRTHITKRCV